LDFNIHGRTTRFRKITGNEPNKPGKDKGEKKTPNLTRLTIGDKNISGNDIRNNITISLYHNVPVVSVSWDVEPRDARVDFRPSFDDGNLLRLTGVETQLRYSRGVI